MPNPNHDDHGRFASGVGEASASQGEAAGVMHGNKLLTNEATAASARAKAASDAAQTQHEKAVKGGIHDQSEANLRTLIDKHVEAARLHEAARVAHKDVAQVSNDRYVAQRHMEEMAHHKDLANYHASRANFAQDDLREQHHVFHSVGPIIPGYHG